MAIYRQGDVMLMGCPGIPKDAKQQKNVGRIVLAWGEATGHAHAISTKHATAYEWRGDTLIRVDDTAELVHEEHDTIPIPAGTYILRNQKEYSPERIRRVVD